MRTVYTAAPSKDHFIHMPAFANIIYYCVPNQLAAKRYLPSALKESVEVLAYAENLAGMVKLLSKLNSKSIVMFNGARFADRSLFKLAVFLGCKCIIIQHGRNEYFQALSRLSILRKLVSSRTYFYESLFLILVLASISLRRLFYGNRAKSAICKLYYFSKDYEVLWTSQATRLAVKFMASQVGTPNPLFWGSVTPIPRSDHVACFLVDEPLDMTLGLADDDFFSMLNDFIKTMGVDEIFVKKHPRSDANKFDGMRQFVEVDAIPVCVDILVGYESNLLFCGIEAKEFWKFSSSGLEVKKLLSDNRSAEGLGSYNDIKLEEFLCDLI